MNISQKIFLIEKYVESNVVVENKKALLKLAETNILVIRGTLSEVLQKFYKQYLDDIQDETDMKRAIHVFFSAYKLLRENNSFVLITENDWEVLMK